MNEWGTDDSDSGYEVTEPTHVLALPEIPETAWLDGEILVDADDFVKVVVSSMVPWSHSNWEGLWARALGIVMPNADGDPEIVGGIVVHDWTGPNMFVSCASANPHWASYTNLHKMFNFIFNAHPDLLRVSAVTPKRAKHVRRVLEKLGFQQEGVMRDLYGRGETGVMYGLLRNECFWLGTRDEAKAALLDRARAKRRRHEQQAAQGS